MLFANHLSVDLWGRDVVRDSGLGDGWDGLLAVIDEGQKSDECCTTPMRDGEGGGWRRTEGVRRCYMHMRHNLEKPKTHICFLCSISIMTTSQSHNRGRGWQWSSTCQTDWGARHLSLMHHGNLAFFYFVKNVWNICRLVLITNLVSVNINLIYFDLIHFLLFFILSI